MDGYRPIDTLATVSFSQHKITWQRHHFYLSVISGFSREIAQNCPLLSYKAAIKCIARCFVTQKKAGFTFIEFDIMREGDITPCLAFGNLQRAEVNHYKLKETLSCPIFEQGTSRTFTTCIYLLSQKEQNCIEGNLLYLLSQKEQKCIEGNLLVIL